MARRARRWPPLAPAARASDRKRWRAPLRHRCPRELARARERARRRWRPRTASCALPRWRSGCSREDLGRCGRQDDLRIASREKLLEELLDARLRRDEPDPAALVLALQIFVDHSAASPRSPSDRKHTPADAVMKMAGELVERVVGRGIVGLTATSEGGGEARKENE